MAHSQDIATQYIAYLGIEAAAFTIAASCVTLRLVQQKRSWGIWWDDWASLAALTLALFLLVTSAVCAKMGRAGYHLASLTTAEYEIFSKVDIVLETLYSGSVSLSKFSLLLLYSRIFSSPSRSKLYVYALSFAVASYWLSTLFGVVFSYTPVQAQWQPWLPHTGILVQHLFVSLAIINTLLDVAILAYPQMRVWKLQTSRRQRTLLSLAFLLGGFTCLASIFRAVNLATFDVVDLTYTLDGCFIWSVLEVNLSIVCSCLPILFSYFKAQVAKSKSNSKSSGSGNGSGNRNNYSTDDSFKQRTTNQETSHPVPILPINGYQVAFESGNISGQNYSHTYSSAPNQVHVRRSNPSSSKHVILEDVSVTRSQPTTPTAPARESITDFLAEMAPTPINKRPLEARNYVYVFES